jgi:hypothetical protein
VLLQNFPQLPANPEVWVQRLHRVLKDHANTRRAQSIELLFRPVRQLFTIKLNAARHLRAVR